GISTASDRNLYLVALAVLALALVLVANLRRTDLGRVFLAVRDAEDAATALGVNLARSKVIAFAISAAMAGIAGLFYAVLFQATPAPVSSGCSSRSSSSPSPWWEAWSTPPVPWWAARCSPSLSRCA